MAKREDVAVWYFIGFNKDGHPIHADHDVFGSDDDGREQARKEAQKMFDSGIWLEGSHVLFHRVACISENHEIALDIKRANADPFD